MCARNVADPSSVTQFRPKNVLFITWRASIYLELIQCLSRQCGISAAAFQICSSSSLSRAFIIINSMPTNRLKVDVQCRRFGFCGFEGNGFRLSIEISYAANERSEGVASILLTALRFLFFYSRSSLSVLPLFLVGRPSAIHF